MKLGVCYYPEHWPPERWPVDAHRMHEAGLEIVRIGEFAWAKLEPQEGQFAWEWLDQAIGVLAADSLEVVLGTPTAAPPAWLCKAHPEVLPVDAQGRRRRFGSRRHSCATSPTFRQYSERIVTALAERYGRHPAVVGWQIDNEFGCHETARCYCEQCAAAFRRWLQARYGSLEALNQAWGTVFWSQTYTGWDEVEPPILTVTEANPSQVLDYYHFSSDNVAEYQQLQIDLLRRYSPGKFITTNLMGAFSDLDYHKLSSALDFAAWDSYPTGAAELTGAALYAPDEARPDLAYDVGDPYVTGFCHDLTRGLKQAPFWVIEQQCGPINWGQYNPGVRPGTVRLWTWHALGSGAEAVFYFRWRASQFAQEQFHSGLLQHDASLATGFEDVLSMRAERDQMEAVTSQPYEARVAIILDYKDLWALQLQPHRRDFAYLRQLFLYYRALVRLGLQVDLVSPVADLRRYKLVLAPTLFIPRTGEIPVLESFLRRGGTLLLGVRSGFKTETNLVIDQPLPGRLRHLTGDTVTGWHALPPGTGYPVESEIPGLGGLATFWAEAIKPPLAAADDPLGKGAQIYRSLATYTGGPFTGRTALGEHAFGAGRVVHLGWYPTPSQTAALLSHLAEELHLPVVLSLPEGVIVTRRGPFVLLLNFTETPQQVTIDGETVTAGQRDLAILSPAPVAQGFLEA